MDIRRHPWWHQNRGTLTVSGILLAVLLFSYFRSPQMTEAVLASTLRQSIPLILGALCGLMGERSGVINIGIEGQMLMAAFLAFLVMAVVIGVVIGALMGLFLAFLSVTLKVDQIIAGTIINIFAFGLTGYYYQVGLQTKGKLTPIPLPGLADIPLIGPVLFNNPPITYLTLLLIFVVQFVLFYTPWGLRSRAACWPAWPEPSSPWRP